MAYLTRLRLSREFVERQRIRDSHDWHQRVWDCFPGVDSEHPNIPVLWTHTDGKGKQTHRFHLTRLDPTEHGWELLIFSAASPTRPPWCPADANCWESKPIAPSFLEHARYRFRLLANPVAKKVNPAKPRLARPDGRPKRNSFTRRIALSKREDLIAWLQRKAAESGFTVELEGEDEFGRKVELLRTVPRGRRYFTKDGEGADQEPLRGVHHGVDFEGVLRVTNPKAFAAAFHKGIGSAKGFGFGLLTLVPLD